MTQGRVCLFCSYIQSFLVERGESITDHEYSVMGEMNQYFYRFVIVFLLTLVGFGMLGGGQVFASGGSFDVPHVNDHFEKVQQGPEPQKVDGSWDWVPEPIAKAVNWTKEKVSSGWNWLKQTADREWEKAKQGDWLDGILALILTTLIVRISFKVGILRGLWDTVKGIGYMIVHPIETIKGIVSAIYLAPC